MTDQYKGSIELFAGPMFAEKTQTLINRMERYLISDYKCIAIKWKNDTRYGNSSELISHRGLKYDCLLCDDISLWEKLEELDKYDVVGIDEGSFFKTIVDFCEELAKRNKIVLVASLIGTFEREGFNDILNLIPKCDKVHFLRAICMKCKKDGAAFTYRKNDKKDIEIVGAADSYMAVCRECYFKLLKGE